MTWVAVRVEQDVGRLQVAVQNAALVGEVHRPTDLASSTAARRGSLPVRRAGCSARLPPSTSFIEKYCCPSCSPTS